MTIEPFLLRAALAGLAVALVAGPLGAFVVWRRMAYFGGALSHSALLGVALGLLLGLQPLWSVAGVTVFTAIALVGLRGVSGLASDTLLGILAHGLLALGLVLAALMPGVRFDLMGVLFGDVLFVSWPDVMATWAGGVLVLAVLVWQWRALLSVTVHAELAHVEGVDVKRTELIFMLLLAITVAVAMKIVGILLITSLLIIPAATVRPWAKSPEGMALLAALAGAVSVLAGLLASYQWDAPAGPAMVLAACVLFLFSLLKR